MTDDIVTQTVTDADATAEPSTEVKPDARVTDDLDTLLAEFDKGETKPSPTAKPEPQDEGTINQQVLDEVRLLRGEREQEKFRTDMDKTLKSVRGDLDAEFFDDKFVEAWIDAQARADTRLSQAWLNRNSNPKQFQRVVEALGKQFAKNYSKLPDRQATEDRAAVTAAVRGASGKAPEGKAPDYKGMSDTEYRQAVRKDYGFNPI